MIKTTVYRNVRLRTFIGAIVLALAVTMLATAPTASAAPTCSPYPDVDSSNQHCENIEWLRGVGITKPADGLFHPEGAVTRGQMTAFLYRFAYPGASAPQCSAQPFPDVSTDNTFCGYIRWAAEEKIAFGYSDGTFGPNKNVTRGAMAAFIQRVQEPGSPAPTCTTKPFADVKPTDMFCPVSNWMKSSGITKGVGDGSKYGTTQSVTRQSMATFLHRMEPQAPTANSGTEHFWFIDGQLAAKISIEAFEQRTTLPGRNAPEHVYIVLDVRVEAFSAISNNYSGYYHSNPYNWYIQDSDGYKYNHEWSHSVDPKLGSDNLYPGEVNRGFLVFDAPEHGTVIVDAPGFTKVKWAY